MGPAWQRPAVFVLHGESPEGGRRPLVHDGPRAALPDVWGLWPRDFAERVDAYAEAQGVTRAEVFRRISAITGNAIKRALAAVLQGPPPRRPRTPVGDQWGPIGDPRRPPLSGLLRK